MQIMATESKTRRPAQREQKEQEALFRWRDLVRSTGRYPGIGTMFAIPNGAHLQGNDARRAAQWSRLRRAGARSGVSDVFLPVARNGRHGLWIEMKAPKPHDAPVTKDQTAWITEMREEGYEAHVAYGWSEAIGIINRYYGVE